MTDMTIDMMLDECLEAVLSRGEDIDSVCSRFPAYESELKELVNLALQGRESLAVTVPEEIVLTNKVKVMKGLQAIAERRELERSVTAVSGGRRRFGLKPLAWITAVFVLLTSGTAIAASGAGPDSFLYPVRQKLENARTMLAWQAQDKARVEIDHAGSRLDEIEEMAAAGREDLIPDLTTSYLQHLSAALEYAHDAAADGEDTDELFAMIDDLKDRFEKLMDELSGRLPGDDSRSGDGRSDDPSSSGREGGTEDSRSEDDGGWYHDDDSGYHDDGYPGGGGGQGGYPDGGEEGHESGYPEDGEEGHESGHPEDGEEEAETGHDLHGGEEEVS